MRNPFFILASFLLAQLLFLLALGEPAYLLVVGPFCLIPIFRVSGYGLWMAVDGPMLTWKVRRAFTSAGPAGAEKVSLTDIRSIATFGDGVLELLHDDGSAIRIPCPVGRVHEVRDQLDALRRRFRAGAVGTAEEALRSRAALSTVRDGHT
ncbi:MAG: hypothetical protein KC656_07360 [Myxococcales bacterium]|nr:hypothetical protein [Myxococcales bacterium]